AALLDAERRKGDRPTVRRHYQAGVDGAVLLAPLQTVAFLQEQVVIALVVDLQFTDLLLGLLGDLDHLSLKTLRERDEVALILSTGMNEIDRQVLVGIRSGDAIV